MKGYNLDLYEVDNKENCFLVFKISFHFKEGNMLVTEEEFVYDSMRNLKLLNVLCSYNEMRKADLYKL